MPQAVAGGDRPGIPPLMAAVRSGDLAAVRALLVAGANPRTGDGRETPLHAAARRGPAQIVEVLLLGGALEWQTDAAGRTALEVARRGRPRERAAVIALLDRTVIADASFRAAVDAVHAGDCATLARLINGEPRLLHERILGPDIYRHIERPQYFRDPKLVWFVAYNPTIVPEMPANITDVARVMIDGGAERADLDYTLALTASSSTAREQGHQIPLIRALCAAGAVPARDTIVTAAAHRESAALREFLASGVPMSALLAAALGEDAELRVCIARADAADVQTAFGLAVINGHPEAARIALDAGADVNAPLPIHRHSTALHQAAVDDRVDLIESLLERGARTDLRDTLWNGTPLGWAIHAGRTRARTALERADSDGA